LNKTPVNPKEPKEFAQRGIMPMEISRHDENWASGSDGGGRNLLGIIILELGNEFIAPEKGAIPDPHAAYEALLQSKANNIKHDALRRYVGKNEVTGKSYHVMDYTIPAVGQPKVQPIRALPAHIKPQSAMGRTLAKIQEKNNATDITLVDDRGQPDKKVVQITLASSQDAAKFAKFAGNAPTNGNEVFLGEDRAANIFQKLGIETHGRANPRPMLDSLKFEHTQNNLSASLGLGQPAKESVKKASSKASQANSLENYYVPYVDDKTKSNISAYDQANQIFTEMQQRLLADSSAKIAITYSANGDQCKNVTDGYLSGKYSLGGGNQAVVFKHLAEKIQKAKLQDKLHILPIATMKHSNDVGKIDTNDVNRDMANIAQHAGDGWQVLGLQNTKTPNPDHPYAIGGGIGVGFHSTEHSERIQDLMKAMEQGNYSDPTLDAAYKKGQAEGVALTTQVGKKKQPAKSSDANKNQKPVKVDDANKEQKPVTVGKVDDANKWQVAESSKEKLFDAKEGKKPVLKAAKEDKGKVDIILEEHVPVKMFSSMNPPEKKAKKEVRGKVNTQPDAIAFNQQLNAGISKHRRNPILQETDVTLKELTIQLNNPDLKEQLGIKSVRSKELRRFENNPGLEIEFEIKATEPGQENQTFKGYAEELPGKNEGDKPRVEYSIDKGMEQALEDAAIVRMCEMAVATAKPNTEFNLQDTPEAQRETVFNALNTAIAKKLEGGTFDEESVPKIVGFDAPEKRNSLGNP